LSEWPGCERQKTQRNCDKTAEVDFHFLVLSL
jgi:hypothetical protein